MIKKKGVISFGFVLIFCFCTFWVAANNNAFFSNKMLLQLRKQYGKAALKRGKAANELIRSLKNKPVKLQLAKVNQFFNRAKYVTDKRLWGKADYWASPFEFIGKNRGDCEDYVIAKYFALRKLGVDDKKLFLTYVKASKQNLAHMVLSYFESPKKPPLILDNYNKKILSALKRKDLKPVYSFNAHSLFLSNASAGLGKSLPDSKLKNNKWRKLIAELEGK